MSTSSSDGNTHKDAKRSQPQEAISLKEAAELLGVTERSIRNYVQQGILTKLGTRTAPLISLHDITTFAPLLARAFDFAAMARTTLRAMVSATRAERRLNRVEALLGIDSFTLSTDDAEVLELYRRCSDVMLDYTEDMAAAQVLDWAYTLSAVTEEYLSLVQHLTNCEEPWVPYMEAAQKLLTSAPRELFAVRKDLEVAYAYLNSARRHLRQVAYFYIRNLHGARAANKACPEVTLEERDADIIGILFSVHRPSSEKN